MISTPALTQEENEQVLVDIQKCLVEPRVTLRFHSLKKLDGDQRKAILQQGERGAMAPSTEALLSRFLATYPNAFEAGATAAESQGQSVRVFCNSDGVSCYVNSFCLGLAWTGFHLGEIISESEAFGAFLKTCVQPTLVPLDVHQDFTYLLGNWLNSNRIGIQQDILEFAEFFLECLQPVRIDGTWRPKWSLHSGPAVDQPMDDYVRGGKTSILSLTLPALETDRCSIQDLVNLWHDELGMSNVFTNDSRGKILHVNRQQDAVKDSRPVDISHEITIPFSTSNGNQTSWISYSFAYHLGSNVENGHYRTMLKQIHPLMEPAGGSIMRTPDSQIRFPNQLLFTHKTLP